MDSDSVREVEKREDTEGIDWSPEGLEARQRHMVYKHLETINTFLGTGKQYRAQLTISKKMCCARAI